jgi:hypothetical protein
MLTIVVVVCSGGGGGGGKHNSEDRVLFSLCDEFVFRAHMNK